MRPSHARHRQAFEKDYSVWNVIVPEGEGESDPSAGTTEDIKGVLEDLREKEIELQEAIAQNNSNKETIKVFYCSSAPLSLNFPGV